MSDTAIKNLQEAIKTAAESGPFALDADFLTAGMNDPDVNVPEGYDDNIKAAFQVASAADFKVTASPSNVSPVTNGSFTVTNAGIPFLGSTLSSAATLVFALTTDDTLLVVQIQSSPANWTWTNSFQFMGGWPFNQLAVSAAQFIYSTSDGKYPWGNNAGRDVKGGTNQNFFSDLALPAVVQSVLGLFVGMGTPPSTLKLKGVFDMSTYNGETVLYPACTLKATLSQGVFKVFYLSVSDPSVELQIPAPASSSSNSNPNALMRTEDPDDEEGNDQAPTLSVSAGLGVGDTPPGQSPYTLQVQLSPPISDKVPTTEYNIGLYATGEGTPLSPASIVSLIGGGGSYFSGTAPVLQQFLAFVTLQGLTLSGQLSPSLTINTVAVEIGSQAGTSWTPIPNAPAGLNFTITGFSLQWSVLNPFDSKARQQSFVFSTTFTLAPAIFKGPDGQGDGVFTVEFTSGLQFNAGFEGTAKLSDFLSTLTGGAVSLPSSIEAELSNIKLSVDYNAKSFSFSSGFQLSLNFLEVGGKPIISISDGQVSVAAITPPQEKTPPQSSTAIATTAEAGSTTAWRSSVSGLMAVGPLAANVSVAYDGTLTPKRWNLSASLAQPIVVQDLIKQFFDPSGTYGFPSFLPGTLTIKTFGMEAVIPSGKGDLSTSYSISTTFSWTFQFGEQTVGIDPAKIELNYDGSKPAGQQFSGLAQGTWVYTAINLELLFGYKFLTTAEGTNQILFVEWQGFRAEYESGKEKITFTLRGWSIGSLIQALVRTLGDPYFTLPSPWDLLNSLSLDGLSVSVSLKSGDKNRLSAAYTLSSPLNLGFITIKSIIFRRDTDGKVTLAIDGSSPIASQLGDVMNPAKGQDVQDMPNVPGRGSSYFKVFLLVLGQRVGITGYTTFQTTKEAITALENVPSTTGKTSPVNPNADKDNPPIGVPYYNQSNNWLIAGHLGLLQVAGVWTIDAMVVFNDPNLYGLRLELAGPKAGGLAGLSIDILYKKITDDIGVFQIEFTFPDAIRNLNFGAVSVTLPNLGVKVYTNGDFFIDIGFPYNLDFQRSFSIAAIIYGVPVLGSGGLYFGKLSNATATQVPKTNKGTFDPVIVFGVGLQLGLGYNFTKGPLSAGFALTVFGIVEGVIAAWHPYDKSSQQASVTELGLALQSDYYFKLSGTVGVIGLLYGKIDFSIIKASVNVKFTLSLQITYESYRAIPLVATATVDISVKVEIDLGLFSITISLSFSATVSATFIIGSDSTAPWDDHAATARLLSRRSALLSAGPDAAIRRARSLQPRPKRVFMSEEASKPTLNILTAPQFTVLAPDGSTDYAAQKGAFVFLFAMDAPDATKAGANTGNTSFDNLCAAFFPWVIDALGNPAGDVVNLADAAATVVTKEDLETYIHKLADLDNPPLSITNLLDFMQSSFTLNIETPEQAQASGTRQAMESGATLFPVFDGLSLSVPDPSGSGSKPITFETYTTATSAYRKKVSDIFAEVQAVIENQNQESGQRTLAALDDAESMSAVTFTDSFMMIGRQLLQAALNLLDSYAYKLKATDSINDIIQWANKAGNDLAPDDVALPNKEHNLSASIPLSIQNLVYTIQAKDTLTAIANKYTDPAGSAKRWATTPSQLIEANGTARILQPDVEFIVQGTKEPVPYRTIPGDSFQNIALTVGISLSNLASQSVLYGKEGLLAPAQQMAIPTITYTTAAGAAPANPSPDTLNSVATLFATTVMNLANFNLTVQGLFSTVAEQGMITLARLQALAVSDLWDSILATDQVAQTAGMVARFLVFGLRLPSEAGLTLSNQFLYPTAQAYGLYQLTGQQFPTPASVTGDYKVTLSRAGKSHGVDLSFITFNGAAGTSCDVVLTKPYNRLSIVLNWAKTPYAFAPSPSFEVLPLSSVTPKGFPINTFSFWSTSNTAGLQSLTNRGAAAANSQAQPILWPIPSSVMNLAASREAALKSAVTGLPAVIRLMPQFQPQVGATSPSTNKTVYTDINNWAWATRVDFQVKRLPSIKATSLANTGAGSVPQGPASEPLLPNVYEMVGPSTADGLLLEHILSAMDALGEGIVSAVFLLYAQSGSSAPTLVTLADPEFLSFVTQTNLSTEANPEAALRTLALQGTPPRGIANTPSEFIKLLWELSVVRSGGYYLFYQVVDGGQGLPASIFDTSGTATLSMVVTFAAKGATSFGNTVLDFVNSVVTTDSIDTSKDITQLLSLSAPASSAPLSGSPAETLETISALYGMGPGGLADINASKQLVNGKVIPVAGIVRQLKQSDLANPANTLNNLAAYYSVGAQNPITGQDIQNHNPGVTVKLGSVYYIPTIRYVVAPAPTPGSAPGNTFGSMSAYYGLSVDEMAINALKVGGLFAANTVLSIDTQVFDLRSTLGPRNIGMLLERVNLGTPTLPDNPTPQQQADYAKAYMFSLYNTLSAGFDENVSFNPSAWGLPFGPQDQGGDSSARAGASQAQLKQQRSMRLQAAAEADFKYQQSLGFSDTIAKINPAPDPTSPHLPPKSDNPYIGVGTTAQVGLRWQDIFGNTTVTPFENPPSNYTGALNGAADTILYNDLLIGVAAWPNTKASYVYTSLNNTPTLQMNFALDTLKYAEDKEQAKRDLGLYTNVYFQLHQDYKNLGVPGVTGNAVSMSVYNSLLSAPYSDLSDQQAKVIRDYVSACVQYLSFIVNGPPNVAPPAAQLSLPVSLAGIVSGNIIELDVSLSFHRNAVLTEPSVAALEQGVTVTSAILPKADSVETVAYVEFATAFENVFQTPSWYMKVGEGLRQVGETSDNSSQQLWAVRFGTSKDQGIYFEIGPTPSYYAPKPIAKSLENKTVSLTNYETGEKVTSIFTGADQNLWFQTCLDAVDTFLSAEYSSSAFILDKILGTNDPLKDGYLGKVLQAKQSLADNIAKTVCPILSTSATDDSTHWTASEKFRQQLLNQIGAAYAAGAVTVFGLSNVSGAPPSNPVGPPSLYGQTLGGVEGGDRAINQNYTLSSARIPLGPTTVKEDKITTTYEPRLAFVFTSKNVGEQAYVPLGLSLNVSHLEFDKSSVPGIEGYTQSRWLAFVKGPFNYKLGPQTSNIPVVNRALPTPPTMQKQSAQRHSDQPATPAELAKWDYSFEYQYQAAMGDSVQVTIELNPAQDAVFKGSTAGPDLFQALAQFISSYPAISRDFVEYLVKIDAKEPDQTTVTNAKKAVAAFEQYITAVATAYAATVSPLALAREANAPEFVKVTFETALDETDEGFARTDIFNIKIHDIAATWTPPPGPNSYGTISNGKITLPAIVIEIDPANYTAVPLNQPPAEVTIAYIYKQNAPGSPEITGDVFLPFADALKNPLRTVMMSALDLLAYQNAWSSIYVVRNRILFPIAESATVSTTSFFLFQTPVVKFADPIVPRLAYTSFKLGDMQQKENSQLKDLLNAFFAGLFSGGKGTTQVDVSMSGGYSYLLRAELPRVNLPINMLPPTEAAVSPTTPPTFTEAVATSIDEWIKTQQPTPDGQPQVDFILNVFGASSAKQPLLVVNDLFCSVIK